MTAPLVTLDQAGTQVEVTIWPSSDSGGLSVLLPAADWAAIVAQGELLSPMVAYRQAESRLASSHRARR